MELGNLGKYMLAVKYAQFYFVYYYAQNVILSIMSLLAMEKYCALCWGLAGAVQEGRLLISHHKFFVFHKA